MNEQNDFDLNENAREEEKAEAIENEEISAPQDAPEAPNAEPQWYSVSYQNTAPSPRRKSMKSMSS